MHILLLLEGQHHLQWRLVQPRHPAALGGMGTCFGCPLLAACQVARCTQAATCIHIAHGQVFRAAMLVVTVWDDDDDGGCWLSTVVSRSKRNPLSPKPHLQQVALGIGQHAYTKHTPKKSFMQQHVLPAGHVAESSHCTGSGSGGEGGSGPGGGGRGGLGVSLTG